MLPYVIATGVVTGTARLLKDDAVYILKHKVRIGVPKAFEVFVGTGITHRDARVRAVATLGANRTS